VNESRDKPEVEKGQVSQAEQAVRLYFANFRNGEEMWGQGEKGPCKIRTLSFSCSNHIGFIIAARGDARPPGLRRRYGGNCVHHWLDPFFISFTGKRLQSKQLRF